MHKQEERKDLAALSFTEKIRALETLRDRSLAIATRELRGRSEAVQGDEARQKARTFAEHDLDRLLTHIRAKIDLVEAAKGPPSFWSGLPHCVIDSVFSIRAKYPGVVRVVNRWCESQLPAWRGGTSVKPTVSGGPTIQDLVDEIDRRLKRGCTYEELFGNRQRTSARSGILKAEAAHRFAKALLDSGINTFDDVRDRAKLDVAEGKIRAIPGQGSGITYRYFLMLAGEDEYVKADVHLRRFASDGLGFGPTELVSVDRTTELVKTAAVKLATDYPGLTPAALDHAIWSYQRTRTRRSSSRHQV